jgi:hypothetical protein
VDRRHREVALVALQAAVLTRRIFLPAAEASDLGPEQWQILIAVALNESTADAEPPSAAAEGLAAQLTLDREHVHALLFALYTSGHLTAVPDDEPGGQETELPRFELTARGHAAVADYLQRAARFLPGWPPAPVHEGETRPVVRHR